MRIRTLYEGHYRAIEADFAGLMTKLGGKGGRLWVVAAGSEQLERLRGIALDDAPRDVVAGIEFLPGLRHLALKLQPVPVALEKVSGPDMSLFAMKAMSSLKKGEPLYQLRNNPGTAHSLGEFFESLFEHGITPELYRLSTMSLSRGQTSTEATVGRLLYIYSDERSSRYFFCADMVMDRPVERGPEDTFLFYGFYDLNPLQRRFVRRLLKDGGPAYWFSPVSSNSPWAPVYERTRKLLEELGVAETVRSDRMMAMNRHGTLFQTVRHSGKHWDPGGDFTITAVTGELGACRAVLDRIEELASSGGVSPSDIAVVRRRREGDSLSRMAHHEGVRINRPLEAALSEIPLCGFVLDLLRALNTDLHTASLERLLSRGMLREHYSCGPGDAAAASTGSGIRMGTERWREWYRTRCGTEGLARLLRRLDAFVQSVPERAVPAELIARLRELFEDITGTGGGPVTDSIFDPAAFRSQEPIGIDELQSLLKVHCESVRVCVRKADTGGFNVLAPERLRGTLYRSVIVMDMEEGVYPRPQVDDPRLSEELRARLQLALRSQRETEDGFLLRQAGEAAEITMDIIYREQAADGSEISPSPFIAPIMRNPGRKGAEKGFLRRASSSPLLQLLGGGHPGQARARDALEGICPDERRFVSALDAEEARMDFRAFDVHDGILQGHPMPGGSCSPTALEAYARCPFSFLASRIWKLERKEPVDVGSSPDPRVTGEIVHDAVERIAATLGFWPEREEVRAVLEEASLERGLGDVLGADYLRGIFVDRETDTISRGLGSLGERGWRYLAAEQRMQGTLGTLSIEGRVDLVLEDGNGDLVLLDIKTGSIPARSSVAKGLYYQLPFYYRMAMDRYSKRRVALVAYASMHHRNPGALTGFTSDEMESMMDRVTANATMLDDMMRRGLFPPAPTAGCDFCGYRGLCRLTPSARIRGKVAADPRMSFFRERLKLR